VKILAVSDVELPQMHNAEYLSSRYADVELLVSCGDMPCHYLDFIGSVLTLPLFFVRGNHDTNYVPPDPGGDNMHLRFKTYRGYTFAGLEGSILYSRTGAVQYTETEMLVRVLRMMPRFLLRRARCGFGVDVMITHSPPRGVHDIPDDYAHRGFRSFLYLIRWARPKYLIHGHVDTWDNRRTWRTMVDGTAVININPCTVLDLSQPQHL
jgi:Icc-related predicted phosphoesterase